MSDIAAFDGDGPVQIRKRPKVTEGIRYTGSNAARIIAWAEGNAYESAGGLHIITDRGDSPVVEPGDWVIRGLVGEYYPSTPAATAAGWELA